MEVLLLLFLLPEMSVWFFVCELTHVQKKLLTQMKMATMISGDNGDNAKLRLGGFGVQQQRPLQSQMAYGFQWKPFTWLLQNVTTTCLSYICHMPQDVKNICYTSVRKEKVKDFPTNDFLLIFDFLEGTVCPDHKFFIDSHQMLICCST